MGQVMDLETLEIRMACATICTSIDGIVDGRTHDGIIRAPLLTWQWRQGQRVTQGRGIGRGADCAQVVGHDAREAAGEAQGGRGCVVQQDMLLEVCLVWQCNLAQVAKAGTPVVVVVAAAALRAMEAAAAHHGCPGSLELGVGALVAV